MKSRQVVDIVEDEAATARHDRWSVLYAELRGLAHAMMSRERGEHTLQTTALVHEAWMRLRGSTLADRGEFFAAAARSMRCILVDHARARRRLKRSAPAPSHEQPPVVASLFGPGVDLLELDAALDRLARTHELAARIAEMRFFVGMSTEEIAQVCQLSTRTVERTYRLARAKLMLELGPTPPC